MGDNAVVSQQALWESNAMHDDLDIWHHCYILQKLQRRSGAVGAPVQEPDVLGEVRVLLAG